LPIPDQRTEDVLILLNPQFELLASPIADLKLELAQNSTSVRIRSQSIDDLEALAKLVPQPVQDKSIYLLRQIKESGDTVRF
jgi:hypothetical protein